MTQALTIQQVHWRTLLRERGELVDYDTGSQVISDVKVVVTRPGEDQVDLNESIAIENKQWDFLIDPDSIRASGVRIVPKHGHKITRRDGTVYTVEPASSGRNCWRWSDGLQTWRRVHTTILRDK